jgi:hypothetical protein
MGVCVRVCGARLRVSLSVCVYVRGYDCALPGVEDIDKVKDRWLSSECDRETGSCRLPDKSISGAT